MKKRVVKLDERQIRDEQPVKWYYLLISIIPIFLFFSLVNEYAVNMPILDDWDAILSFITNWTVADQNERIKLIFAQHNEHRIIVSRLVYLVYYTINNNINFIGLGFISNIQLIFIFAFLVYFSAKLIKQTWPIIGIFTALCVFDPSNFENATMAMAGMANYGVIMLFMTSLFFYSLKSRLSLVPAILFQILCAFSNGNGIIGGIALVLYAIGLQEKPKIIGSSITLITSGLLYYSNYNRGENNLTGKEPISIIEFFLRLLGGHFDRDYRIFTAICLLAITFAILYFSYKKLIIEKKEILPFIAMILFILMTIASISVFRSGQEGMIETYSYLSRYLIYPHLYAGIIFIIIASYLNKGKWIIISVAGFIFIKSYTTNYKYGEKGFKIFRENVTSKRYQYPIEEKAEQIAIESCKREIYCIEENREPTE